MDRAKELYTEYSPKVVAWLFRFMIRCLIPLALCITYMHQAAEEAEQGVECIVKAGEKKAWLYSEK